MNAHEDTVCLSLRELPSSGGLGCSLTAQYHFVRSVKTILRGVVTGQVARTAIGDVSLPVTQGRGPVSPWGFAPVWLWWSTLITRPQPSMHATVA